MRWKATEAELARNAKIRQQARREKVKQGQQRGFAPLFASDVRDAFYLADSLLLSATWLSLPLSFCRDSTVTELSAAQSRERPSTSWSTSSAHQSFLMMM